MGNCSNKDRVASMPDTPSPAGGVMGNPSISAMLTSPISNRANSSRGSTSSQGGAEQDGPSQKWKEIGTSKELEDKVRGEGMGCSGVEGETRDRVPRRQPVKHLYMSS